MKDLKVGDQVLFKKKFYPVYNDSTLGTMYEIEASGILHSYNNSGYWNIVFNNEMVCIHQDMIIKKIEDESKLKYKVGDVVWVKGKVVAASRDMELDFNEDIPYEIDFSPEEEGDDFNVFLAEHKLCQK